MAAVLASPAHGAVNVVFGTSWDSPDQSLQNVVDARYGRGSINVTTDYLGAKVTDPDPWFWIDNKLSALLIREIARNHNQNVIGWYEENGSAPVIDGVGDGVVFDGKDGAGATELVSFDHPMTRFGFYLDPKGPSGAIFDPQYERFFTNRHFNGIGTSGVATHTPFDGDVQALVYDVSRFTQPNTWLVCFEDLDSGANPGPCCYPTDNDFNDFVFEVTAFGATPTIPMTIGALKARYLH